jgi:hypothetical protein
MLALARMIGNHRTFDDAYASSVSSEFPAVFIFGVRWGVEIRLVGLGLSATTFPILRRGLSLDGPHDASAVSHRLLGHCAVVLGDRVAAELGRGDHRAVEPDEPLAVELLEHGLVPPGPRGGLRGMLHRLAADPRRVVDRLARALPVDVVLMGLDKRPQQRQGFCGSGHCVSLVADGVRPAASSPPRSPSTRSTTPPRSPTPVTAGSSPQGPDFAGNLQPAHGSVGTSEFVQRTL